MILLYSMPDYAIEAANTQVLICLKIASLCILISVVWNFGKTIIYKSGSKIFDLAQLLRPFIILSLLFFYTTLAEWVFDMFDLIADASDVGIKEEFLDTIGKFTDNLEDKNKETGFFEKIWNNINAGFKAVQNVILTMGIGLFTLLLQLISGIVLSITQIFTIVMFVVGPYSLVFSILPGFESKLDQWFKTYCTLCFVPVVLNVFDTILMELLKQDLIKTQLENSVGLLVINLVFLVVYMMPFWVAGKVLGSVSAGRFLSTTVGVATMGTTMALKGSKYFGSLLSEKASSSISGMSITGLK